MLGLLALPGLMQASLVTETRTLVEEWVNVEKTISAEASAWREKEETLKSLVLTLEQEKRSLEARIGEQRKLLTTADEQRGKVLEKEKQLVGLHQTVRGFLQAMESTLRKERTLLPQPLQMKLEEAWQRLPRDSEQTTLGVAERMQNVITILAEIQKFNAEITLSQELRTLGNGEEREVKTLYLGLGIAYYLAADGEDAGYGQPGANGWSWVSDSSLVSSIRETIAIYEKTSQEARFVALPVPSIGSR